MSGVTGERTRETEPSQSLFSSYIGTSHTVPRISVARVATNVIYNAIHLYLLHTTPSHETCCLVEQARHCGQIYMHDSLCLYDHIVNEAPPRCGLVYEPLARGLCTVRSLVHSTSSGKRECSWQIILCAYLAYDVSTFMNVPSSTAANFLILSGFLEAVLESTLCKR